jgi:hypothetical protein
VEGGAISSIPNLISSFICAPIGAFFTTERSLNGWIFSFVLICATHLAYLFMPDHIEN